jgi:hypothetical protein
LVLVISIFSITETWGISGAAFMQIMFESLALLLGTLLFSLRLLFARASERVNL